MSSRITRYTRGLVVGSGAAFAAACSTSAAPGEPGAPSAPPASPACEAIDVGASFEASGVVMGGMNRDRGSCGGAGPELAFRWTAAFAGRFVVEALPPTRDWVLYVRRGSCSGREVGCSGVTAGEGSASVEVDVAAGETLFAFVDGPTTATGNVTLKLLPPQCGALAIANGYRAPRCEHDGNAACGGRGPRTSDCDHCCDTTCGDLARQNAWTNPLCEHGGNGACGGAGPATSDCAHCCDGPSPCCLALPQTGTSRGFDGCTGGKTHYGIDYPLPVGTPLAAPMSGTVVALATGFASCWNSGSCGGLPCSCACLNTDFNFLKVRADCGDPSDPNRDFYMYFSHIDGVAAGIQVGARVERGDVIAYSGNSGCSSGPHLHLETVSVPKGAPASLATCDSVDPVTRGCQ